MGFYLAWSEKGSFETSRDPFQGVRCTYPCCTTPRADHNVALASNLWLSACMGYIWAITGVGMEKQEQTQVLKFDGPRASQGVAGCDIHFGPS